jgi:hypothetical protein
VYIIIPRVVTPLLQAQAAGPQPSQLQIALKNNVGVNYFSDNVLLHSVFTESVSVEQVPTVASIVNLRLVSCNVVLILFRCRAPSFRSGSRSNLWRLRWFSRASAATTSTRRRSVSAPPTSFRCKTPFRTAPLFLTSACSPSACQVARRRNDQGYEEVYTTSRCGNGAHVLCMLVFAPGKGCKCSARSSVAGLAALMMPALEAILA